MLQYLRAQARGPDTADSSRRWLSASWLAVLVGGIYILSAKLSLALLTPEGVAVFWPAAGVAAGALITAGPRARWPVVTGTMVATIVANLMGDRNGRCRQHPVRNRDARTATPDLHDPSWRWRCWEGWDRRVHRDESPAPD